MRLIHILGIVSSLYLCGCELTSTDCARTESTMTLDQLSEKVGVSFPAGATVIGIDAQNGMDDMIRARISIDRGALQSFQESCPVPADLMEDDAGSLLGSGPPWWVPSASARVGQMALPGARALHIGIDDQGNGKVDIYVVNHGT